MQTLQILMLVALVAVLAMEVHFMWTGKRNGPQTKVQPNLNINYKEVTHDPDEERFHLAPLGNLDEEYMNLFSNPPMEKAARRGKSAYLRDAYHERIRTIVNALNIEDVNISSYVDMVLTDHFMRYEAQIDRLIQNSYNDNRKKQKQWQPS